MSFDLLDEAARFYREQTVPAPPTTTELLAAAQAGAASLVAGAIARSLAEARRSAVCSIWNSPDVGLVGQVGRTPG